jgi:hypothetical protein
VSDLLCPGDAYCTPPEEGNDPYCYVVICAHSSSIVVLSESSAATEMRITSVHTSRLLRQRIYKAE